MVGSLDLIIVFSGILGLFCVLFGMVLSVKSKGKLKLSMVFITTVALLFTAGTIVNFLTIKGILNISFIRDLIDLVIVLFLLFSLFSLLLAIINLKKK